MKKLLFFTSVILCAGALMLSSCKKGNNQQPEEPEVPEIPEYDVYVYGMYGQNNKVIPCLWLNGEWVDNIPNFQGTEAANIYNLIFSGGKFYAVGSYQKGEENISCYWADGLRTDLELPQGGVAISAYRLDVSEGNVYVLGHYYTEDKAFASYWVDGKHKKMPILNPIDESVQNSAPYFKVLSGKIYSAGYSSSTGSTYACYWDYDGQRVTLDTPAESVFAVCTFLDFYEGKAYASGYYDTETNTVECCWIDGERKNHQRLADNMSIMTFGTQLSGGNIYLYGGITSESGIKACYWINEQLVTIDGLKEKISVCSGVADINGSIHYLVMSADDMNDIPAINYWNGETLSELTFPDNISYDVSEIGGLTIEPK